MASEGIRILSLKLRPPRRKPPAPGQVGEAYVAPFLEWLEAKHGVSYGELTPAYRTELREAFAGGWNAREKS